MDDPNQINSADNTPKDDPQIDTQEYQNILNKYAQEISKNPPEVEAPQPPDPELPPQDIQLSELPQTPPEPPPALPSTPPEPSSPPDIMQHELPPPLPPEDDIQPPMEEPLPSKPNPFVKILFFFSLLIFLAVSVGLIYVYFVLPIQIDEQSSAPLIQNTPTSIPSGVCLLNDQSYNVGESFSAADGCNTCTCQEDLTISCTEIACDSPSSAIPADWKFYSDKTLGISFNYPKDWEVDTYLKILKVKQSKPDGVDIPTIDFKNTNLTADQLIAQLQAQDQVFNQLNPSLKPLDTVLNGYQAQKLTYITAVGLKHYSLIANNNSKKIQIDYGEPTGEVINQILSTFKFL